jgi:hypothetical protein
VACTHLPEYLEPGTLLQKRGLLCGSLAGPVKLTFAPEAVPGSQSWSSFPGSWGTPVRLHKDAHSPLKGVPKSPVGDKCLIWESSSSIDPSGRGWECQAGLVR